MSSGGVLKFKNLAYASGGLEFEFLTSHPYASQSGYLQNGVFVTAGHTIEDMAVTSSGDLIAGYGDWTRNLDSLGVAAGRVGIEPYNIQTNSWGTITYAGSEALDNFRIINGSIYAPTTDPSTNGLGGYMTNVTGSWQLHKSSAECCSRL
jgi:hypothetical protein